MLPGRGCRVHRDHDLGPGLAQDAHRLAQGVLVVPHLSGEGLGHGVVEVDLVEVVDVGDPRLRDCGALLALADQPQGRPLLGTDGVAAALSPRDGDDARADVVVGPPLPERRQGPRLVVRVGPDEDGVEVGRAARRRRRVRWSGPLAPRRLRTGPRRGEGQGEGQRPRAGQGRADRDTCHDNSPWCWTCARFDHESPGPRGRRRGPAWSVLDGPLEHPGNEVALQEEVDHHHRQSDDRGAGGQQRGALGVLAREEAQPERRGA